VCRCLHEATPHALLDPRPRVSGRRETSGAPTCRGACIRPAMRRCSRRAQGHHFISDRDDPSRARAARRTARAVSEIEESSHRQLAPQEAHQLLHPTVGVVLVEFGDRGSSVRRGPVRPVPMLAPLPTRRRWLPPALLLVRTLEEPVEPSSAGLAAASRRRSEASQPTSRTGPTCGIPHPLTPSP
jgi:hypothetical protein